MFLYYSLPETKMEHHYNQHSGAAIHSVLSDLSSQQYLSDNIKLYTLIFPGNCTMQQYLCHKRSMRFRYHISKAVSCASRTLISGFDSFHSPYMKLLTYLISMLPDLHSKDVLPSCSLHNVLSIHNLSVI